MPVPRRLAPFFKERLRGFPAGSKAAHHALEVSGREGRQHNLAVPCFKVYSRPRFDVEHGADLLWDHDLSFRADDGGFHRNLLHLGETIMPVPNVPGTAVPGTYRKLDA